MNSKKLVIFSFVSLILFGLILNLVNGANHLNSNSVVVTGDGFNLDNWTLAGLNSTVNFTLNLDGSANNITNITIEIPNNVVVFDLGNNDSRLTNGTYTDSGTWTCENTTSVSDDFAYTQFWECLNDSTSAITNVSTFNLWFNFTANASIENYVVWNVSTQDDYGSINSTEISINADGLAPRLSNINVSDGYTVLTNDTLRFVNLLESSITTIDNGTLRGDGSLTVTAEFEDFIAGSPQATMLAENVHMFYYTTYQNDNVTQGGNGTISGQPTEVIMTTSDTTSPYSFTGTITGLIENNITTFVFLANDSFNQLLYRNNSEANGGADAPYAVLTNTTNVPVLSLLNVSDGNYNISVLSGGYLRPGTQTFTVNADGRDLFGASVNRDLSTDGVIIYYNTTGNLTTDVNGYVKNADAQPILLANNTESGYSAVYSGSASIIAGNDTNMLYYAIVANTTEGAYYTLLTGQYKIDNSGPTSTAITDDDTDDRISLGGSITFTCSASDAVVGVDGNLYTWKVTRGGDTEISLTSQTNTLALSSTSSPNTNKIDTYTIKCIPYDLLGHSGTEKSTTITVSSSGGTSASSTGGGSSSSATPSFDVDLSTSTTGSISGSVGRIRSFSFDGSTKHTVTFKEITATSAKITIASTPIDVVLNVGETKKVDINNDGTNDLEVKLDNIKFGTNAEITINKLETGAKKVVEEEKKASETETTEETKTTEPTKGTGWIWITLLIIVVLVTVGYYVFKKK